MQHTRFLATACIAATLLVYASNAAAVGTEIADQSASASGTAGAGTARDRDPGAAYFNPAALADGYGLRAGLGAAFALPSIRASTTKDAPAFESPSPFDESSKTSLRVIPQLAVSYAFKDVMAGVSAHVPFGGGVTWPSDWPLRFDAIKTDLRVIRISPFVGARFSWLRVAAGPNIDIANLEVERATQHVLEEGKVHLALHGIGFGGQIAFFAQASKEVTVGLSYKSRSVTTLKGDADFTIPVPLAAQYPDQDVSAKLKLPDRIALGTMIGLGEKQNVRVLGDLVYALWSINDELVFDFARSETPDSVNKNEWHDALTVRVGVEADVAERFVARGGLFVDGVFGPAGPPENLAPSSPDMTRLGASLGGGMKLTEALAADVFYSFFTLLERSSSSANLPLATYSGTAHVFGLGLRVALGGREPAEKTEAGAKP